MRYYEIIIVQEPEKDYSEFDRAYANHGHEMPFRKIRLLTLQTPKLDVPISQTAPTWIHAEGQDVQFSAVAEDWDGHKITFSTSLMFIPYTPAGMPADDLIWQRFVGVGMPPDQHPLSRNQIQFNSQVIAFAPSAGSSPATHLKTQSMMFDLQMPPQLNLGALPSHYPPHYAPALKLATVEIPAVNQILGRPQPADIVLDPGYLQHGFEGENSKAEVFAALVKPVAVNFAADKAGGLAKPDMGVSGLTRVMGAVAALDSVRSGKVDVSAFMNAELLGGIKIGDILNKETDQLAFDAADFAAGNLTPERLLDPNLRIKAPVLTTQRTASSIDTRYVWKPAIDNFSILKTRAGGADNGFGVPAQLILDATLSTPLADPSAASFRISGRFLNFALDFASVLKVKFVELAFLSVQGKKPDVTAEGVELIFQGPLQFVNTLKDILPSNGFSDPPYVDVDTSGIRAGYTLAVPSVGVGIFSIQNIALGAALSVPFVSQPAGVRFNISERHHPFIVTVGPFGGGGFFALAVSARGLEQIEAAIEFGGSLSLNLGVASGGVYVMAGIYFNMTGSSVALTGYLRCGGSLEVLGIISISVEFYLSFTYRNKGGDRGEAWGQASVTVSVKVACFSKSVTLTVERKFAGAAGDPTFADLVEPDDWAEYCLAFA